MDRHLLRHNRAGDVMSDDKRNRCGVCDSALQTEKEKSLGICFECRRYGLLHGSWPQSKTAISPQVIGK
jgi:hypothetical protein